MKNIFLIGLPSSGKSSIGRTLAQLLSYRYSDLDKCIEQDQQMTITRIFETKGEKHFREVESTLLQAIAPKIRLVVATGGGTPCFFDNMEYIKANGISVFLDVPANILTQRIVLHSLKDRPLLSKIDSLELENELQKKYTERLPFYSQADITVRGETDAETVFRLIQPLL